MAIHQPKAQPDKPAANAHRQAKLEKVPKHLRIGISQGLERSYNRALLLSQTGQEHVEHKRRHGQEHRRRDNGEAFQAFDFLA